VKDGVLFELNENLFFLFGPAMKRDFMAFEGKPLEQTRFGGGARDERGDDFPALVQVVDVSYHDGIFFAVFADEPDEYLEITDAPVPLQLAGLSHP
jgi:hypothetical protein